ncbi:MAG: hypothetical protein WCH04_20895 [Gammaproteobacteria bacterium]
MTKRNNSLPAVFVAVCLAVLAGCTGMNGGEAVTQAAPVPPPPGDDSGTDQQDKADSGKQEEDLPDRVFAPLDDAVNVINRDMNREIDKEFPENETSPAPDPGN